VHFMHAFSFLIFTWSDLFFCHLALTDAGNSMVKVEVNFPDRQMFDHDLVRHALDICCLFRDAPEQLTLTSVILALALHRIFISKDYSLLIQMPELNDEQLRRALALSLANRHHSFMEELQNQNASLYERFCRLLPGKLFRKPPAPYYLLTRPTKTRIRKLDNLEDDYELLDIVGKSDVAKVYRARCLRDGCNMEVAIKVLEMRSPMEVE
ncbi:hypothetical protein BVRB_025470, partial [Beta vulgaris subsp. vulgaris]